MEFFTISMLNGLSYGLLLFMLSSGLTLIFSMMGVLNFAHAGFYMLGAYAGYTVPPYYDSMIAKLIVQGNTREEALKRMQIALESFVIEGVKTTMPFLARVMQHPGFKAGKVHTKWLEFEGSDLLKEPT